MAAFRGDTAASGGGALFASVPCARVITLEGSSALRSFTRRLRSRALSLSPTLTVQTERRDPEGGLAGVWRAHVRAWNASHAACSHLLVFEDDVFLDPDDEALRLGVARADALVRSGKNFDFLLLGWVVQLGPTGLPPPPFASPLGGLGCTYSVQKHWRQFHAYIVSRRAMHRLRKLPYEASAGAANRGIDVHLAERMERLRVAVVRPMVAFQSYHESSNAWWPEAGASGKAAQQAVLHVLSSPDLMHTWEDGPLSPFEGQQQCSARSHGGARDVTDPSSAGVHPRGNRVYNSFRGRHRW